MRSKKINEYELCVNGRPVNVVVRMAGTNVFAEVTADGDQLVVDPRVSDLKKLEQAVLKEVKERLSVEWVPHLLVRLIPDAKFCLPTDDDEHFFRTRSVTCVEVDRIEVAADNSCWRKCGSDFVSRNMDGLNGEHHDFRDTCTVTIPDTPEHREQVASVLRKLVEQEEQLKNLILSGALGYCKDDIQPSWC